MGDAKEKDSLVTRNLRLVHACANRFRGRGVEYEDLFQAGCVGLVKAAAGFDETLGFRFSTYAVPAILGEIRRVFRDGGSVKVGRAAKEKARVLLALQEELTESLGREPTVRELAEKAALEPEETAVLLGACLPALSLTQAEEGDETDIPVESIDEAVQRKMDLSAAMDGLSEPDRRLIELRYFQGLTQTAAAARLGMTQVQVSRREKKLLLALREALA